LAREEDGEDVRVILTRIDRNDQGAEAAVPTLGMPPASTLAGVAVVQAKAARMQAPEAFRGQEPRPVLGSVTGLFG
jgi:hypothetical protein